nr:hypothetical protein [Chitinophagaceae bacterium]
MQKLDSVTTNGNNMILRVEYYADSALPDAIDIYEGGTHTKTLKDDGIFPDSTAGDFIYATYLTQSISGFLGDIASREAKIISDGGVYNFEGHDGEFIKSVDIPAFNVTAFNNNQQAQVYLPILNVTSCELDLLKQNSLFITDLAVVEDPARTYKFSYTEFNNINDPNDDILVPASGNSSGAWTFGTLMGNIANTALTGVSTKEFLKKWIKTWTVTQRVGTFADVNNHNYDNVVARSNVRLHLIDPWITKVWTVSPPANQPNTPPTSQEITNNGWEYYWDLLDETDLVNNAPFKLMAIVNRVDTRGNAAYTAEVTNAGETRFIFTLLNPVTGKPPLHNDPQGVIFGANASGIIDWVGMNVIIEYGNPITNNCDLKSFVQQWYDLSSYTLGSSQYNDALELITNQVTDKNMAVGKNVNNSALNQIRSNERILSRRITGQGFGQTGLAWDEMDWELRQFQLESGNNGDGNLHLSALTNTPVDETASDHYLSSTHTYNYADQYLNSTFGNLQDNNVTVAIPDLLLNWIYGPNGNSINRIRVSKGNHNIPETFLAGVARLYKETVQYFGFDWQYAPPTVYDPNTYDEAADAPDLLAKTIRHQISLNTCQGCHGGENKTNFTHVFPRGYGEEANYWDATPSIVNTNPGGLANSIDDRFEVFFEPNNQITYTILKNNGKTYEPTGGGSHKKNFDFIEKTTNTTNQVVSPFLTGRKYSNQVGNSWEDDELNNNTPAMFPSGNEAPLNSIDPTYGKLSDEKLTGLFFVNDPSNQSQKTIGNGLGPGLGGPFPQQHSARNGFNDLERRKIDLCKFINLNCNGSDVIGLMANIIFTPFPLGGH